MKNVIVKYHMQFRFWIHYAVSKKEELKKTDLYHKETDETSNFFQGTSHPKVATKAISYSLALRIVRICSELNQRDVTLEEMK